MHIAHLGAARPGTATTYCESRSWWQVLLPGGSALLEEKAAVSDATCAQTTCNVTSPYWPLMHWEGCRAHRHACLGLQGPQVW